MNSDDMVPIELLSTALASEAPPASLLLPYGEDKEVVQLRFDDAVKLAVRLDPKHPRAFTGVNIEGRHLPSLVLADWSLRVDPASAYSAFNDTPQAGDVFICGASSTRGMIVRLDHATRYVSFAGAIIPEPKFGEEQFVGFRSWAIGRMVGNRFVELVAADLSTSADG